MAREYFCAYHSYLDFMEELGDAECGRLFKACLEYSKTGATPELRGNERFVFAGIRTQIDRDKDEYDRRCMQNSKNRSSTTVNDRQRTSTNVTKEKEKEKENIKENTSYKRKFSPPSVEEVSAYCQEKGYHIDAEMFVSYYEARGWMLGKTKMSSWKHAVVTWAKKQKEERGDDYWA